ncbi:MAG: HD domain-containing protein [Nanoarchaeota archaeon]|nr:HD domain-containing protein [Nanoarchaeota archaeon]
MAANNNNILKKVIQVSKKYHYESKEEIFKEVFEQHIKQVVNYSKKLARKLSADSEVCEIAAWLYDISRPVGIQENHSNKSADIAKDILKQLDYDKDKIKNVKHCIKTHSADYNGKRRTVEAKILASSDALSHLDRIPELLDIFCQTNNMSMMEAKRLVLDKVEKGWKLMLPEAKELGKKKYEAVKVLLK